MKRFIRAVIGNSPAMNTLMVAILVVGTVSLFLMRREIFPNFKLEIVLINVPYPGASPTETERGICQKIEEAVQTVEGIKKMTSVAQENMGSVVLELRADVKDVQRVVAEVRSEVDRIPSFPELAEDPKVQQITFREPAINVALMSPADKEEVDELEMRAVAENVRDEILQLSTVSQVKLLGTRDYQIDIEISEDNLRKHKLSLPQVAAIVRQENLELPAGKMRGAGEEVLLRSNNKRLVGEEIAELPIVTDPNGVVLTLGDLGIVRDEFADGTAISELNGRAAIELEVERTTNEDLLALTEQVRTYVAKKQLPGGYELLAWGDRSIDVRDRLEMLIDNGRMGLILVFLILAVFLELKLAFWVALGIPIAMLGAGGVLLAGGQTLNMLSMFAFLMALGIIVDDAIVVGENIYAHRQMGSNFLKAAIDGTCEVIPSVTTSVLTTIIAFCPLLFVSGVMGKFIAVMPLAVIAMLAISLFESTLILPCHLAHKDNAFLKLIGVVFYPFRFVATFFEFLNRKSAAGLDWFIEKIYIPTLQWCVSNMLSVVAAAVAVLILAFGIIKAEIVPFTIMPELDSNYILGNVTFPDGTSESAADEATKKMVAGIRAIEAEHGKLTQVVYRRAGSVANTQSPDGGSISGSHVGSVTVELVDNSQRNLTSSEIANLWRAKVGEIAGVEYLSFGGAEMGPGGSPIEFKLLSISGELDELEAAVEEWKAKLDTYDGIYDITDDSRPGKWEFQISIKERAKSMGVRPQDLAETVRASYYGAEVMRLQRGRHEVKLMVRYPEDQRKSLTDLNEIRVRTVDGLERPITELAEIKVVRGYNEINRLNQKRSITITADVDEDTANARQTIAALQADFLPELQRKYPNIEVRWEGQQEQTRESIQSLLVATMIALLVMFALLTFEFKSYFQPIIILSVIPFGLIGAIMGHAIFQMNLTLFSFFGLVALTGVVVNDSIVLVDFINARVRANVPVDQAVIEAGRRRFRPVLLTSATTIAGLVPILLEKSFQAQVLIPMAISLAFGLMMATVLVLVLVPTFYRIYRVAVPYKGESLEDEVVAEAA